jgi:hypothetical protein
MRHLSTLIIFALILGLGHFALANGGPAPVVQAEEDTKPCAGSQSPEQNGAPKQDTTTIAEAIETAEAMPKAKEVASPTMITGKNTEERKEVSEAKKENSSLTFNFLYYIFYKFSVSDFFQTPSYNGASGLKIFFLLP